jgi:hypothetical protein
MMNSHQLRFGSWVVNGKNYTNKLSAVIDAVKTGHWIHWNFNDQVFAKHDWTQEPAASLADLYGARARRLREQYAHIAVDFSGGADSWNLLYHFCRQNLPVDTVIHRYSDKLVKSSADTTSENQWAEGKFQAWPSFQRLRELNPDLKWHTWEITDPIQQGWATVNIDFKLHNNFHPGAILKLPGPVDHNPAGIPDLPSSAMIYGLDKPVVELRDGKFYLLFYDYQIILRSMLDRKALGIGMQDVLFYWDPENVMMLAKQGHVIMNWFRANPEKLPLINHRPSYQAIVNRLIYPEYQLMWQSERPTGLFSMSHERWFTDDQSLTGSAQWHKVRRDYTDILEATVAGTEYTKYLKEDNAGNQQYQVLAACPSNAYYLGSLK